MVYQDIKQLMTDAKNLAEGANDLQLKSKLLDIQGYLYELQDENRELRLENEKIKNEKITESRLIKVGSFWKLPDKDYLYCPKCWGKDKKLIVCNKGTLYDRDVYQCPVCDQISPAPKKS